MIKWQPRKTKAPAGLQAAIATLSLPVFPGTGRLDVFDYSVTRLSSGRPVNHIILLAGGPGQKGSSISEKVGQFSEDFGPDFVLYAPDHRGTGKSGKFAGANRHGLSSDLRELSKAGVLPIESITIENAAWDVVALAEMIKRDAGWLPESKLVLLGCSYGGIWGSRAVNLRPELFDWLFLNSALVASAFWDPVRDRELLRACAEDTFCHAQMGGNVDGLRNAMTYLADPSFNECTRRFHQMVGLAPEREAGETDPSRVLQSYQNLLSALVLKLIKSGPLGSRPGLAFIKNMYQCHHPEVFGSLLAAVMEMAYASGLAVEASEMVSMLLSDDDSMNILGDGQAVSTLINVYMIGNELYDFSAPPPAECAARVPLGLFSLCSSYWSYKKNWERSFAELPKSRPARSLEAATRISSSRTKVLVFQGALDPITPLPALEKYYAGLRVPYKRMVVHRNYGHVGVFSSPCSKYILGELLHGGSTAWTDLCVVMENRRRLDWSFENIGLGLLWAEDPSRAVSLPTRPNLQYSIPFRTTLSLKSDWDSRQTTGVLLWAAAIVGVAAAGLGLLLAVVLVVRRRRASRAEVKG